MKKLIMCAALVASTAHAEFKDGNMLLSQIQKGGLDYSNAIGYITGVYDALNGYTHCPPANVTAGQVTDMVRNYLTNVPADRSKTGDELVLFVLKSTWPCASTSKGKTL